MKDLSSPKQSSHYPVMLDQVLKICEPGKGGDFIDCTFGSGGYSNAILSFPKTKVIALDRDLETQEYVNRTKKSYEDRFSFHSRKFSELNKVIESKKKFDFIIFDLGISSLQIFNLERGFSFNSKSFSAFNSCASRSLVRTLVHDSRSASHCACVEAMSSHIRDRAVWPSLSWWC